MNIMTKSKLEVVPLTKHIGAEIRGIDLRERPDDATIKAIYQAWLDHLVIVFPGQKLSQEDLLRATTFFGTVGELSRPATGAVANMARPETNMVSPIISAS